MVSREVAKGEDYRFPDELAEVDPDVSLFVEREQARQREKLIMIPSESIAPRAVRSVLGSVFTSLYAEGYPALRMRHEEASLVSDVAEQLALHRRYGDRRFYKGTEFANLVEALAQHRVAQLFASHRVPAAEIFANVQPLSGAAANNAVYAACMEPGDTMLGLALSHGGHLTHGSAYNRSGRYYHAVPYGVNPSSGRIDYDELRVIAQSHHTKLIVAGASAYPWDFDWPTLREIADECGALLLADIAHPAGLVVAGLFPNPVGFADVVTFTTHKTLCGPRGAVILTTDEALARRIDQAVFPGEQGGPHMNNIAAMAVAFGIARMPQFHALQRQIVANARALADALAGLGLKIVYGGTSTHLLLIDLNALADANKQPLKADVASRMLDVAGIVCNKNTIPGDHTAAQSSGLRFGTVWATQRGLREAEMVQLAGLIRRLLAGIEPFSYIGSGGELGRGKVAFGELQLVRTGVSEILSKTVDAPTSLAAAETALEVGGPRAEYFLQEVCASQLIDLLPNERRMTAVLNPDGKTLAKLTASRLPDDRWHRKRYALSGTADRVASVHEWFAALSDGYVVFDPKDIYRKIEGPVVLEGKAEPAAGDAPAYAGPDLSKPYFVGQTALLDRATVEAKEEFTPSGYEGPARPSCLYEEHQRLNQGRNMVTFAGWIMPAWYASVREEHRAVRETAALFDISHMGVIEVAGTGAQRFLDLVTTNYVPLLSPGQSEYAYILDPDGNVLDDVFVYCRSLDRYMLVMNAANAEKVQSWLEAVQSKRYLIDRHRPGVAVDATAMIRDLKAPGLGSEGRVDISLQGPQSRLVLLAAIDDGSLAEGVIRLDKGEFVEGMIGGIGVLISRTGYTGEEIGFELYMPPEQAASIWRLLLERGRPFGVRPAGLAARDSARTEAGFPLYGHELAGPYKISPACAGYGQFVKLHKPFFIGRHPYIQCEQRRASEIVRFRVDQKGVPMLRTGDPVVDERGKVLGHVTSSVVVDGKQVGMACLTRGRVAPGGRVRAFPLSRARGGEKPLGELAVGDTALLAVEGTILPRFGLKATRE